MAVDEDRSTIRPRTPWLAAHGLWAYFAIAYAVSWLLWLPAVATVQGWWEVDVPRWWHHTGAAGPITAAVAVSSVSGGFAEVRRLFARYSPRQMTVPWLAFAVLMPCILFAAGAVVIRLTDGAWPTLSQLGSTDNLPFTGVILVLLAHVFTFGIGEETGWRGLALPRLQIEATAMQATHRLAVFWLFWHLPSFFENDSMMGMSAIQLVGWAAGLWMGAIFLTWLFNSSRGSLLVVVLWHGLFNLYSASNASSSLAAVETIGVIVVAIVAIRLAGPADLTGLSPAGSRQRYEPTG